MKAVDSGLTPTIYAAMRERTLNANYKIDFGKLHQYTAGHDAGKIKRCVYKTDLT